MCRVWLAEILGQLEGVEAADGEYVGGYVVEVDCMIYDNRFWVWSEYEARGGGLGM